MNKDYVLVNESEYAESLGYKMEFKDLALPTQTIVCHRPNGMPDVVINVPTGLIDNNFIVYCNGPLAVPVRPGRWKLPDEIYRGWTSFSLVNPTTGHTVCDVRVSPTGTVAYLSGDRDVVMSQPGAHFYGIQ